MVITLTNVEVQLIENPADPSLFVAISRLRRFYLEMADTSWTGPKKHRRTKRHFVAKHNPPGQSV